MNTSIFTICGESDQIPDFDKIKSDPNYIFEADPGFIPLTLFNESGSAVTVNSWIECANYVNGGWMTDVVIYTNYEETLFYTLFIVSFFIVSTNIYKKLKGQKF